LKKEGIKAAAYLKAARAAAKAAGYDPRALTWSDKPKNKLMIYDDKGKASHFGRVGYGDFIIYTMTKSPKAETKRKTFHASHSKIKGDWKNNKYSPNMLALKVLW
jgi:hypothetical protein